MLNQLRIQNYAIIDEIDINFSPKLNVITGETGAGKSILMGALSLILGERADTSVLMNRDKKCFVEGVFSTEQKKEINTFLKENDLDTADEELVIRREISSNGKSRAFVNDTPVNLDQLRSLSSLLVDLHQQFDTLSLSEADFQRQVLDAMAGHAALLQEYQTLYRQWQSVKKALGALQEQKAQFDKESGYNQFLFDELNEANFSEDELEKLDAELRLLSNAEGIKTGLSKVYYDLKESEQPVVQQLKSSVNQLQPFSSYHDGLPPVLQRLQSAQIELQDIASELMHIMDHIQFDPQRMEEINERLSTGYKLLKKHGLHTTAGLLNLQQELQSRLRAVLDIDDRIAATEKEMSRLQQEAKQKAALISANRQAQVPVLETKVNQLLRQVGMPNARLKPQVRQAELGAYGMDEIEFLFDANKSNRFEPVRKVASGGELSRLMLCIKSLVAQSMDLPTLIFDEIDSGISGEAAKQVGIILKELSKKRQVICITHQPQIAGKADAHYFVYKEARKDTIKTSIRLLTQQERVVTIAQMLSGEKPTAAAMENAKEMMN